LTCENGGPLASYKGYWFVSRRDSRRACKLTHSLSLPFSLTYVYKYEWYQIECARLFSVEAIAICREKTILLQLYQLGRNLIRTAGRIPMDSNWIVYRGPGNSRPASPPFRSIKGVCCPISIYVGGGMY